MAQSNLQKNSVLTNKVKNLMKTYNSCTDTRAYSLEADKRNKYLLDILNGAVSFFFFCFLILFLF